MAESDLINQEDIEEISSVLQLNPHQKNTTFTTVTKTEEGDLVSLDELYEKTGQEAIGTFLNGFDMLVKNNKLSRAHGMALNIQGAESWMIIPDRMNAIKGGEGFFSTIVDTVVSVVKAIISFITGVCNWIATRVKALFGFGETAKETELLYDISDGVKDALKAVLTGFGVSVSDEFLETIPSGITLTESFTITKKSIEANEEAFGRLSKAAEYIKDYKSVFNKWTFEIRNSKRDFDRLMITLRNKVRNKNLTVADTTDFILGLSEITSKYTDTSKIFQYLEGLSKALYGIEINGLGTNEDYKKLKEEIEKTTEQLKISYNPNYAEQIRQATLSTYKEMFGKSNKEKITGNPIKDLKSLVKLDDGEFIQSIEKADPKLQISPVYLKFCHDIAGYTSALEYTLKLIQKTEVSINNMIRWKDKVDCLLAAYITRDIVTILEAHKEYLTPKQRANLEKVFKSGNVKINSDGSKEDILINSPRYLDRIDSIFNKFHPDGTMTEEISNGMRVLMETPVGNDLLKNFNRFKNQLKGK